LVKGEEIPIIRRSIPNNNSAIDRIRTTVNIPILGKTNTIPAAIIERTPNTISRILKDRFEDSLKISI